MKTVKYRTDYERSITKREVIKETEHQIIYVHMYGENSSRERREAKSSAYHSWHDSFEDAKQFLIDKQKQKIESAKRQIECAELKIAEIEALTLVNN